MAGPPYRWVLKDVGLEVGAGGEPGVDRDQRVGQNDLVEDYQPGHLQTAGLCAVKGRIGRLLSVTAGLHPDLTGRENVYSTERCWAWVTST